MDSETEQRIKASADWLQKEFGSIRSGQATPGLLDGIKVENYGSFMPVNQMSSVSVEDARTIRVSPWDSSRIAAIERAISEANLGVSVSTDSAGLRVIFPELTSDRRVQLLKLAKAKLEEARVSVRSARDEAMKKIDSALKAGDLTEDDKFAEREAVQKVVDATNQKLDTLFSEKEVELNK